MENEKITLNYKASNIAKAEEKYNKNFLACISGLQSAPSFRDMRFLILAGGGTDEDFDKLVASGIENLMTVVLEGINNAGFLGEEKIDIEALKAQLHETMEQAGKALPNFGEATKEQPTK